MDKTVKESRLNHWFILIKECLYHLRVLNKLYIKIGLRAGEKKYLTNRIKCNQSFYLFFLQTYTFF